MAAATFTLTGDLAALVGSATKRGAYVQLDRPVTDPTNDIVYEMTSRTTVEGSFSLPTLPAQNALNNSGAAFNMVVTIGSRKWLVPAQSAASTHDLTEFTETTGVVPANPITYALRAPDYVTGRAYIVGELVTYSGTLYRITTAYTSSGGSLDLTKATAIGGGGSAGQPLQQVATTVTASGAAVANKHNPADATGAARTISLPTGQAEGTQISVEKTDSSINTVAITGNIRGVAASTISLTYLSESLMLRADSAGSWWPIAGHRTKSSLDAAYLPSVDNLALTRLERQTVQSVQALSRKAQTKATDAAVTTEPWTNLTQWPTTLGTPAVNSGRLVGNASAYGVQMALNLGATETMCMRIAFKMATGGSSYGYVILSNDANGTINGSLVNAAYLGFGTTAALFPGKGTNVTGSMTTVGTNTLTNNTDYFLTVTVDDTWISFSVQAETDALPFHVSSILRSQLPGGPTINNLLLSGINNNNITQASFGQMSMVRNLTIPPLASRTVAGKALFGNGKNVLHSRVDSTTGIRHLIAIPGDHDARVPAPLAAYFHADGEYAGYAFRLPASGLPSSIEVRASDITKALLAAGYIVVASDNGTSLSGGTDDRRFANPTSVADYAAVIKYARDRFSTGATFLYGASMGVGAIINTLASRDVGGIAAAAVVCPGLDLVAVEANPTYTSILQTAYGASDHADFLTKIAGKNPIDTLGYKLRGIAIKSYIANADSLADPNIHWEPLRARLLTYAVEAPEVVVTSTTHADPACYQPSDVLAFFEKYR